MSSDRSPDPIFIPASNACPRRGSIGDFFTKQTNPADNQAAKQQVNQQRRLSITTLGLSGSPTQTSTFDNRGFHHGSLSSSWESNAPNEDVVAENTVGSPSGAIPTSPFARRASLGALALRDASAGSIGNRTYIPRPITHQRGPSCCIGGQRCLPQYPVSCCNHLMSPHDDKTNTMLRLGNDFNWTEALSSRAKCAPSLGGPVSPQFQTTPRHYGHERSASVASMERPVREIPKQSKPDFFEERILHGDFME